MNKVTTINLNGKAYLVEEAGYTALSAYLAQAAAKLESNPDKDEIMQDFQQAVADKFQAYLSPTKDVITSEEVQKVLEAMGPVDGGAAGDAHKTATPETDPNAPRKFYRVHKNAVIFGVCSGIAEYFNIDVTLVRLLFIVLAVVTSGGFIGAYLLMGIFLPSKDTRADVPFNAQEFIQQAQASYTKYGDKKYWKEWKRGFKRDMHAHRYARNYGEWSNAYSGAPTAPYLFPFINVAKALLLVAFIVEILSIIGKHMVFGVLIPSGFPIWAAIIVLFAVYQFLNFPLKWAKYRAYHGAYGASNPYAPEAEHFPWSWGFWQAFGSLVWIVAIVGFGWLAYTHIPEVHTGLDAAQTWLQQTFNH